MSILDNTRIGEIFAAQKARADGFKTREEFQEAFLETSRLCAAAYTLEVVTNAIAAEPDRSKRKSVAAKAMLRYIDFLSLIQPAFFRTPAEAEKTRKAIQMALLDARDISANGGCIMNYELSPWFSGDTPPVRPGVYEREVFTLGERRFAYFHGSHWALWDTTPEHALKISNSASSLQDAPRRRWRGILNPSGV